MIIYDYKNKRQTNAGPYELSLVRDELCEDLRKIYDFEIEQGNTVERIDRFSWDKVDLVIAFSKPLHTESKTDMESNGRINTYVNIDPHYPLETSCTSTEFRQAITSPNK